MIKKDMYLINKFRIPTLYIVRLKIKYIVFPVNINCFSRILHIIMLGLDLHSLIFVTIIRYINMLLFYHGYKSPFIKANSKKSKNINFFL